MERSKIPSTRQARSVTGITTVISGASPKLRDSDLLRGILPTLGASPSGRTLTSTLRRPRKLLRLLPAETRTTPNTTGTNFNQIPPVRNWSEGRASRLATQHLSATCTRTDRGAETPSENAPDAKSRPVRSRRFRGHGPGIRHVANHIRKLKRLAHALAYLGHPFYFRRH
jgi:hypothetical protein